MQKDQLEHLLKSNKYLKGGTKEACVKVREFLSVSTCMASTSESVRSQEFVEAVETLVASAYLKDDEIPERWHCDSDCIGCTWSEFPCEGEYNLDDDSEKLCPYFREESLT